MDIRHRTGFSRAEDYRSLCDRSQRQSTSLRLGRANARPYSGLARMGLGFHNGLALRFGGRY